MCNIFTFTVILSIKIFGKLQQLDPLYTRFKEFVIAISSKISSIFSTSQIIDFLIY